MKYSKLATAVSAVVLLNGCLEVEDNSNAEVVTALQEQNQILTEQGQQKSVAIRGSVVNLLDGEPVSAAKITVKSGNEILAADVEAVDGKFKVNNLPSSSDLDFIVSSDTGEFMTRAFFYRTDYSEAPNNQQDIGALGVSASVEVVITVLNSADNSPVTDLVFKADSSEHIYTKGSGRVDYLHLSTFDEVNGVYKITLPKYIYTEAIASLDIDNNGELDYALEATPYSDTRFITLYAANTAQLDEIYLLTNEDATPPQVEFRIAVVDELGAAIAGANLMVDDRFNDDVTATYNAETGEYVLTAAFPQSMNIQIPAFTVGDDDYNSASISINEQSDGRLAIYYSGVEDYVSYYIPAGTDSIDLSIQPQKFVASASLLDVVLLSEVNPVDSSMTIFYSQPVNLDATDVTLTNLDAFTVTKGNAHSDDSVSPGTTLIKGGVEVPVSVVLSKNNTRLAITPNALLVASDRYDYVVGNVDVLATNETIDINSDGKSFAVPFADDLAFDISQVRLDNNNYTTNGSAIIALNTAGDPTSAFDYSSNVYIVLPTTINSLQSFTMEQTLVIRNGSTQTFTSSNPYTIVENGNIQFGGAAMVATAANEDVFTVNANINLYHGMNTPDLPYMYAQQVWHYLSDHLSSSENSITFEYSYETKAGEAVTGTVTLNVE